MRTRNLELIVGVFILAGLLALAVLASHFPCSWHWTPMLRS